LRTDRNPLIIEKTGKKRCAGGRMYGGKIGRREFGFTRGGGAGHQDSKETRINDQEASLMGRVCLDKEFKSGRRVRIRGTEKVLNAMQRSGPNGR